MINKIEMSEEDVRAKYIDPSLKEAGWNEEIQIRREVSFTAGRIFVKHNKISRGKRKKADYILSYKMNFNLAVIEAKKNTFSAEHGIQQGIEYGEILDIPFIYSCNGERYVEFDRLTGETRDFPMNKFPSPEELFQRYLIEKKLKNQNEDILIENYYYTTGSKVPRYYQVVAVNRAIEAVAKGQERILLVMATGTGKTYTAFQIIWRLWKARKKKRILFLADRNILVDQTMSNDFRFFGDKMIKISRNKISKAHEIYLGLYQSMTGTEDWQQIFKEYSRDFFDLVIIDECHRGSAKEDSAWREILEYFSSATQIGMTATPKETKEVSNINYFGEPVYTYSLKQGISDGFLAPYKVIRYGFDKDLMGFRPEKNQKDRYGEIIEDKEYTSNDYDKTLVLTERQKLTAKIISDYMKENDRFMKTIVFCQTVEHAESMTKFLAQENSDLMAINSKYVMTITGDNPEGKAQLDNFIDPKEKYPVIATTSKLLTTGVDAKTCKLIVLDSIINSMTEFKQIIGRGTRVEEDYGKTWFTILDFRNATRLFADPEFDGEPIPDENFACGDDKKDDNADYSFSDNEENSSEVNEPDKSFDTGDKPIKKRKFYVDDVKVWLLKKDVRILDADGKLVAKSFEEWRDEFQKEYRSYDEFLNTWTKEGKKRIIVSEFEEKGIDFEALKEEIGADLDEFDIICHLAFDKKPITRKQRAEKLKRSKYLDKYRDTAREILDVLLEKYTTDGVEVFEDTAIFKLPVFQKFGTPTKIVKEFGSKQNFINTMKEITNQIYL